jgi:hypothetical protein
VKGIAFQIASHCCHCCVGASQAAMLIGMAVVTPAYQRCLLNLINERKKERKDTPWGVD